MTYSNHERSTLDDQATSHDGAVIDPAVRSFARGSRFAKDPSSLKQALLDDVGADEVRLFEAAFLSDEGNAGSAEERSDRVQDASCEDQASEIRQVLNILIARWCKLDYPGDVSCSSGYGNLAHSSNSVGHVAGVWRVPDEDFHCRAFVRHEFETQRLCKRELALPLYQRSVAALARKLSFFGSHLMGFGALPSFTAGSLWGISRGPNFRALTGESGSIALLVGYSSVLDGFPARRFGFLDAAAECKMPFAAQMLSDDSFANLLYRRMSVDDASAMICSRELGWDASSHIAPWMHVPWVSRGMVLLDPFIEEARISFLRSGRDLGYWSDSFAWIRAKLGSLFQRQNESRQRVAVTLLLADATLSDCVVSTDSCDEKDFSRRLNNVVSSKVRGGKSNFTEQQRDVLAKACVLLSSAFDLKPDRAPTSGEVTMRIGSNIWTLRVNQE